MIWISSGNYNRLHAHVKKYIIYNFNLLRKMPIPIDVSQGYLLPTPAAVISICVYLKLNVSRNESVLFPNER